MGEHECMIYAPHGLLGLGRVGTLAKWWAANWEGKRATSWERMLGYR